MDKSAGPPVAKSNARSKAPPSKASKAPPSKAKAAPSKANKAPPSKVQSKKSSGPVLKSMGSDQGYQSKKTADAELDFENLPAKVEFGDPDSDMDSDDMDSDDSVTKFSGAKTKATKKKKNARASALNENIRFRRAYERAIENGDPQKWGWCKLMVIGQGAAGKTSTVRTLLGLAPKKEWESTVGVDLKVTAADDWAERDRKKTDFNLMLHKAAAEIFRNEEQTTLHGGGKKEADGNDKSNRKSVGDRIADLGKLLTPGGRSSFRKSSKGALSSGADKQGDDEVEEPLHPAEALLDGEELAKNINLDWVSKLVNQDDTPIRFSIWDYGGQEVFYALHHIFLTRFGIYLLVFDMRELLKHTKEAVRFLRFWLNSVKLHAPHASVVMIGTYMDVVSSEKDHKKIEKILRRDLNSSLLALLVKDPVNKLSFFPVDNSSTSPTRGLRIRKVIEEQAASLDFVNQKVSLRWIKILSDLVEDEKSPFKSLREVNALGDRFGVRRGEVIEMLQFFNEIGALVHFNTTEHLRVTVITQPQWILDKLSKVIADEIHVEKIYYDPELKERVLTEAFDRLRNMGIASREMLSFLWEDEKVDFLIDFMKATLLLSDWKFDGNPEYLVTSLLIEDGGDRDALLTEGNRIDKTEFAGGLSCALDFAAFYLPDGVFQRLVPICAEYSAGDPNSITPKLSKHMVQMSFGWTDFLLQAIPEEDIIRITFKPDTSGVGEAIKLLVSMFRELKDNVMSNLSWALILYSPRNMQLKADYDRLEKARANKEPAIRSLSGKKLAVNDFDMFFENEASVGSLVEDDYVASKEESHAGLPSVQSILPPGLSFHCFLSHKQLTGGDLANVLFEKLSGRGLKIWYDQAAEHLNKDSMAEGIKKSKCYLLLLTKDVFKSGSVLFELSTALKENKQILLVHEPDTRRPSYADFTEYIDSAPAEMREIFDRVESMPFQRRYFLEKAFMEELVHRIAQY